MDISQWLKIFWKRNGREAKFFILFIVFFIAGQVAYYNIRHYSTPRLVHSINAVVSSHLINLIRPQEKTTVHDRVIRSGAFQIRIATGCDGIEAFLLIAAALCAFPMGMGLKLSGVAVGTFVLYVCNLGRIIGLYFILKYKPHLFEVSHVYVGQTFIILVGVCFFVAWIGFFSRNEAK